jgi:PAS domain S-box-containing protein
VKKIEELAVSKSEFTASIEEVHRYQADLQTRIQQLLPSEQPLLAEVCEELQISLEEMQVANEELIETRKLVEIERQHYQDLFEFAPDGYLVTDLNGTIQDVNQSAATLLNLPKKFLIGKPLVVFVAQRDRPTFLQQVDRIPMAEKLAFFVDLQPRNKATLPAAITVVSVQQPTKTGTLRWMVRDITQQRQIEQALQRHQDNLEALIAERTAKLLTTNQQLQREILERQQAEATLRQQTERERLLRRMMQRIRESLQLDEVLMTAVTEMRAFLHAERVVIYQIQPHGEGRFIVESAELNCASLLDVSLQPVFFAATSVAQLPTGYVSAIANVETANLPPAQVDLLLQLEIRANLAVLLTVNQQPWGFLCVQQCTSDRQWQPVEQDLLQQFATQLEIAIQQSSLYQQLQQLNANLDRQVQHRTAALRRSLNFEALLKRITDRVRVSLDEDQILRTVVQELPLVLGIVGCNAALYNYDEKTATICHDYFISNESSVGQVIQMSAFSDGYDQLLAGQCFQFCELPQGDVSRPRRYFAKLACPMCDDKVALGDLWLFKPLEVGFDEQEVRLVQQVADQCAIAIRQARLYQTSQLQVEELRRLDYIKNDFLNTVSHELRTPVANMQMAIQMLKLATTPEKREQYLNILQAECRREANLVNDILNFQRLEAEPTSGFMAEVLDLQELITRLLEPIQIQARSQQQQVQVNLPAVLSTVVANRNNLERLLSELLENACKYTPANGEIRLSVEHTPDLPDLPGEAGFAFVPVARLGVAVPTSPNQVRSILTLVVQNSVEIPADQLPRIFEKFYRVPKADPWKHSGTGLGLALVQRLVEQMQGNLQVESWQGWTKFVVQLPIMRHRETSE